jgi:hypothetical protein
MTPLGVLDHGFGLGVAVTVIVVTIALLVERQLLLAYGGERARATVARQARATRVLGILALIVIALRLAQLFNP